eukprot:CAMPEP_0198599720 /NCGR_PEP_ID=MMETSP1462-20131121/147293_1 /TAXON_ID=1333877 /ORGANISM="Brandtodinium nutriculum, Strain RCC3387" /LENGTH=120 /DNA_ID=CAMNT_0044331417 /DNA_START=100 /DNA_END=459 /DNA_ORIENTATION=+
MKVPYRVDDLSLGSVLPHLVQMHVNHDLVGACQSSPITKDMRLPLHRQMLLAQQAPLVELVHPLGALVRRPARPRCPEQRWRDGMELAVELHRILGLGAVPPRQLVHQRHLSLRNACDDV